MRALSIRQPYAELILRGIKTAELRTFATSIVGERFYIYRASVLRPCYWYLSGTRAWGRRARGQRVSDEQPAWMIELAEQVKMTNGAVLRLE